MSLAAILYAQMSPILRIRKPSHFLWMVLSRAPAYCQPESLVEARGAALLCEDHAQRMKAQRLSGGIMSSRVPSMSSAVASTAALRR